MIFAAFLLIIIAGPTLFIFALACRLLGSMLARVMLKLFGPP